MNLEVRLSDGTLDSYADSYALGEHPPDSELAQFNFVKPIFHDWHSYRIADSGTLLVLRGRYVSYQMRDKRRARERPIGSLAETKKVAFYQPEQWVSVVETGEH